MINKITGIVILIVTVGLMNCSDGEQKSATEVKSPSVPAAVSPIQEKIRKGALILDVRTEQEFATGHYPGAINIPIDRLQGSIAKVGPKDRPIVVYCATGNRSIFGYKILVSSGYRDVTDAGGIRNMPMNISF